MEHPGQLDVMKFVRENDEKLQKHYEKMKELEKRERELNFGQLYKNYNNPITFQINNQQNISHYKISNTFPIDEPDYQRLSDQIRTEPTRNMYTYEIDLNNKVPFIPLPKNKYDYPKIEEQKYQFERDDNDNKIYNNNFDANNYTESRNIKVNGVIPQEEIEHNFSDANNQNSNNLNNQYNYRGSERTSDYMNRNNQYYSESDEIGNNINANNDNGIQNKEGNNVNYTNQQNYENYENNNDNKYIFNENQDQKQNNENNKGNHNEKAEEANEGNKLSNSNNTENNYKYSNIYKDNLQEINKQDQSNQQNEIFRNYGQLENKRINEDTKEDNLNNNILMDNNLLRNSDNSNNYYEYENNQIKNSPELISNNNSNISDEGRSEPQTKTNFAQNHSDINLRSSDDENEHSYQKPQYMNEEEQFLQNMQSKNSNFNKNRPDEIECYDDNRIDTKKSKKKQTPRFKSITESGNHSSNENPIIGNKNKLKSKNNSKNLGNYSKYNGKVDAVSLKNKYEDFWKKKPYLTKNNIQKSKKFNYMDEPIVTKNSKFKMQKMQFISAPIKYYYKTTK